MRNKKVRVWEVQDMYVNRIKVCKRIPGRK